MGALPARGGTLIKTPAVVVGGVVVGVLVGVLVGVDVVVVVVDVGVVIVVVLRLPQGYRLSKTREFFTYVNFKPNILLPRSNNKF